MSSNLKYLNRISLALIFLTLLSRAGLGQSPQGLYLTGEDFNQNKLSFQKSEGKKCRVKLNEAIYKPLIRVNWCDSTYIFKKDSIFGYRDNRSMNYRFVGKESYLILNQGEEILLYETERIKGQPKSPEIIISHYFSKNSNSPVLPLNEENLMGSFKDEPKFLEYLEIHFSSDSQLLEYDSIHKMYKLNRLLQLSRKPKNN